MVSAGNWMLHAKGRALRGSEPAAGVRSWALPTLKGPPAASALGPRPRKPSLHSRLERGRRPSAREREKEAGEREASRPGCVLGDGDGWAGSGPSRGGRECGSGGPRAGLQYSPASGRLLSFRASDRCLTRKSCS